MSTTEDITTITALLQELSSVIVTVREEASKKNMNQDEELGKVKQKLDEVLLKTDRNAAEIKKLAEHLDNGWRKEFVESVWVMLKKEITNSNNDIYEIFKQVLSQNYNERKRKNDFAYKLILELFGAGGLISLIITIIMNFVK